MDFHCFLEVFDVFLRHLGQILASESPLSAPRFDLKSLALLEANEEFRELCTKRLGLSS